MRAPLPDLDALDIETLKALILSQHEEKQQQLEELDRQRAALDQQRTQYQDELRERAEQIEHLRLVVEKLRRMLFGRKSEKLSIQLDQLELQLEEMEVIHAALASLPVCDAQPDSTGAKPARKPLPEHLPRQIVTHEPKQQCCPECGGDLRHFGEDVSEQLDYAPESFRVIRHVRPKFTCSKCETVVEAPAPSRPIARGLAAPGLLAHVLVSKYADHCPLYRQAEIYARQGVELDRSTLAGWVGAASELLAPLVDAVRRHVLGATKLHADDTPVPVLAPGNGKTKTGRLWTYVRDDRPAGDHTAPAVWFAYSPDRKGEHPREHLKNFTGTLQADAYSGFHHLYDTGRIREAACWAHARRKFHDIHAAHPSPTTTGALDRIGALYGIEQEVRGKPPDERRVIRQARAAPLLAELRAWMEKTLRSLSPKSETAEAIRYALSRWRALTRYVDDGRMEIDNSAAERALRAVALGRKNYLFCGSDSGGESAAAIYTLLGTARLNGVDPERWLREVLGRIADHPLSRIEELLPWNMAAQLQPGLDPVNPISEVST
jgi:transposase